MTEIRMPSGEAERDTAAIREIFGYIASIPRCSGNEDGIARFLRERVVDAGCMVKEDDAGNLFLGLPGAGGGEDAPPLVLQAHMDMVCVAAQGSDHDFAREGIDWYEEDGILRARETTLGADNGIGLAIGIRLLEEPGPVHPPIQLIATREEETTMHGAAALDPAKIAGTTVINIDDEEEGVITTSSAGMMAVAFTFPAHRILVRGAVSWQTVEVAGGRGGHSGMEAGSGRANALSLIGTLLTGLMAETGCAVTTISGGERDNAIPGQARACIGLDPAVVKKAVRFIREEGRACRETYRDTDPDLRVRIFPATPQENVISPEIAAGVVSLLSGLPAGVCTMDVVIPDLVATSCNPATIREEAGLLTIGLSARSNDDATLAALGETFRRQGKEAGAAVSIPGVAPAWQYREVSPIRERVAEAYSDLFGSTMHLRGLHAGLETAWIAQKIPEADIISLGPDIRDAHTVRESASLPSAGRVCLLLRETLRRCVEVREEE
ncbi:beta-Ala-His dipeptidase [Methanogenium organophilum]|uniref:Beta-Ala-His dipeptidase n=1 Tax=Methanogenium organophilum TaxID=2199 RepID=A0A9X9S657_METOG|nr:beta-Ala-His dipeptidase [Methanogenium organophilum]WAI02401.1 beta-Ala-His dipeptidase [Methanogenium organophilum]